MIGSDSYQMSHGILAAVIVAVVDRILGMVGILSTRDQRWMLIYSGSVAN